MESCVKAREAYQAALGASSEIRQILNSQGDTLDSLITKFQETMKLRLVRKDNLPTPVENPLEENVPALLRQIQESNSSNGSEEKETHILAAPKKKLWQL